jgi:hypothetical protein
MTWLVPTHLEPEEWAAHPFEFGPVADWEVLANEMPATPPDFTRAAGEAIRCASIERILKVIPVQNGL